MKIKVSHLRNLVSEVIKESFDTPLDEYEFDIKNVNHLYSLYSDMYKEIHGIRPRWKHPSDHDAEGWTEQLDFLEAEGKGMQLDALNDPYLEDPSLPQPMDNVVTPAEDVQLPGEELPRQTGMGRRFESMSYDTMRDEVPMNTRLAHDDLAHFLGDLETQLTLGQISREEFDRECDEIFAASGWTQQEHEAEVDRRWDLIDKLRAAPPRSKFNN